MQQEQAPMQAQPPADQTQTTLNAPTLPPRTSISSTSSDLDSPVHYTRDPHRLVAYIVPFPKPKLHNVAPEALPPRFLIYTPPPPPLQAPKEGEKEAKFHKVQRKWQDEVRAAKESDAKTASWKGVKSKVTKGISTLMGKTKTTNLEFLNRIGGGSDENADDDHHEGEQTHKTVALEEMTMVYPASLNMTPDQLRQEFIDTMMRSKTKAQRDAVIATGLLPVSAAIDICATLIWPFGGLLEIDSVWAYGSIRGAKTSRSVTKRLTSSSNSGDHDEDKLRLVFKPSPRVELLDKYLAVRCHEKDSKIFPPAGTAPTETEVLQAIGWSPSQHGGEEKNWEDEQWETSEVKEDLKASMTKGAKEWDKWVQAYEKNPEKALKK